MRSLFACAVFAFAVTRASLLAQTLCLSPRQLHQ